MHPTALTDYALGFQPNPSAPPPSVRHVSAEKLSDLDLDQELLHQYKAAVASYEEVRYVDTPANQKAQLLNSITSIITNIVKLQTDLLNAERLKKLESTLISVLKKYPEMRSEFLEEYERALRD